MKLGLQIGDFSWAGGGGAAGGTLAEIARTAEAVGFDLIGVADHLWQVSHMGGPERPELECFTTLGVVAASTTSVGLIPLVAGVHFRPPAVLAKAVTTLDVLSGGRAWLGIGAGWYEEEARGMGVPFPPPGERLEMLEEALQICLRLWSDCGEHGDERPFVGKHYRLERPLNSPPSLSRPHPPILVGGGGERKTLRLVARYADACNLYPTPDLPTKLDALRRHCEAEGRPYEAIRKTCMFNFDVGEDGAKAGEVVERLRQLAGFGIELVIGFVPGMERIAPLEVVGRQVIPAVAEF